MTHTSLALTQFWKLSPQNAAVGERSVAAVQIAQDSLSKLVECERKLETLRRHLAEIERQTLRGESISRIFEEISGEFNVEKNGGVQQALKY
jgi:hypothetical protein